jgi:hypothetical protein
MYLETAATLCANEDLKVIIDILKTAYTIIQIAVPIILLIIGTVDLGKAVMAGEEKEIKAATGMLAKRAGAAVAVFLLIYIVQLVTGLVGGNDWRACWKGTTTTTEENGETGGDETDDTGLGV